MLRDLLNLFYPPICLGCESPLLEGEEQLCITCRLDLPIAAFHRDGDPFIHNVFYGKLDLEQGTSLFYYEKEGTVQHLIHQLKYRKQEQVGELLGNWLGVEIKETGDYSNVDYVIPVPIHSARLRERGYNQVELFGKRIAHHIDAQYCDDVLLKTQHTAKQAMKSLLGRTDYRNTPFAISQNHEALIDKHILLVDDVLTTGATLEKCGIELFKIKGLKLSIVTMAIAT